MIFSKETELSTILSALKCGDMADEAFVELAIRYEPMMQARVGSMFKDPDEVMEAMQEAHVALHSAALTYDGVRCEGVTFGLYAGICVCNRLRSMLRAKERAEKCIDKFSCDGKDSFDVESSVVDSDTCERVMQLARGLLSELEYSVFRLEFEGYTTRDIARKLSRTPKSIDNAKARISRRLRSSSDICGILS